jgi:hypothetical protein
MDAPLCILLGVSTEQRNLSRILIFGFELADYRRFRQPIAIYGAHDVEPGVKNWFDAIRFHQLIYWPFSQSGEHSAPARAFGSTPKA